MGRQMSERAEFHVMGQPLDGKPLHYTASGLDYVYLNNGFSIEEDADYGRTLSIDAVDDLHRAIGLYVIEQPRGLTGAEFRFLRKQMGFKQTDLAERFGTDVQTIANYEKGKKIPPISDNYMRMFFALWIMPPDERAEVLKQYAEEIQRRKREKKNQTLRNPRRQSHFSIVKKWQVEAYA
jgi:transcriptional regulator with XRE-family HTH domain